MSQAVCNGLSLFEKKSISIEHTVFLFINSKQNSSATMGCQRGSISGVIRIELSLTINLSLISKILLSALLTYKDHLLERNHLTLGLC